MAYCSNCGAQIADNTKFCPECGSLNALGTTNAAQRQQEFMGKIFKCPNCGELLKSFVATCPSCGYEIRATQATNSIHEFAQKIESVNTEQGKIDLVRTFPIPNTKEDIFEFMILTSTNITGESRKDLFDAWIVKFEQSYQKAQLVFRDESDFSKVQDIYEQTHKKIKKEKRVLSAKSTREALSKSAPTLPNIVISSAWIISLFVLIALSFIRDGTDSVIFAFDLLVGAIAIPFVIKCDSNAPKLIVFFGLGITIVALAIIEKFVPNSEASVLLVFDIIATAVIVFRGILKKAKNNDKGE